MFEYSSYKASVKAAAAVYAARLVILAPDSDSLGESMEEFVSWTPTLRYYTKYEEGDVAPIAKVMLRNFVRYLEAKIDGSPSVGVMKKYKSNSMHGNLIAHPRMNLVQAKNALEAVENALVFSPKEF